ncbi:hypothetical protein L1D59_22085 [Pseudoalteromonas piscicida]|uniref:Calx-beta domain-containing protein n=1 Tax=Pseudoalteromonas piscicida TaxID=43662 RepID=UPI001EFDA716|nr:Calx-beta domain-containing protein [Pseudoalteromonas piscicida]MCG9771292.1 hypothetical protein [Pseudoalteromonas piscicida]
MSIKPIKAQYYCSNIEHCSNARAHKLFTKSYANKCGVCAQPLLFARWHFSFVTSFSWVLCLSTLAALSYPYFFPKEYENITFSGVKTEVQESSAVVEVTLHRTANIDLVQQIELITEDGTAKAAEDYRALDIALQFQPGEVQKSINIPIIPDSDVYENNEMFYIKLKNVKGQPSHIVMIVEAGVNKDLVEKSSLLVSNLSALAADLSNDLKQLEILGNYLSTKENPKANLVKNYRDTQDNIQRAREKYIVLFNEALDLDPNVLRNALDAHLEALKKQQFHTQYEATTVMKAQLLDYLSSRVSNSPKWLEELGEVVKLEVKANNNGSVI